MTRRLLTLGFHLLVVTSVMAAEDMPSKEPAEKRSRPSAQEPLAAFSLDRAAAYLDQSSAEWTSQRQCATCHTNIPYLVARPLLNVNRSTAETEVRSFFEKRVTHWDDPEEGAKPRSNAEVIAIAQALALHDAATTGTLQPLTQRALDRMWTLQRPEGDWNWVKCGWPPFEHDDYYGAVVAAIATGHAPQQYEKQASAQRGLERLRTYFKRNAAPDLHHQTMLLWASTRLEGLMAAGDREQTIQQLRSLQRTDGGWSLSSLGQWKRRNGSPNDPAAPSDGYATGLIVYVLRETGLPASDPAIERAVAWLKSNQRASGRWFTRSLNNDKAHYITDAGTSFAAMALSRCAVSSGPASQSPAQAANKGD